MTDQAADNGVGDTTTNHQWRASAAALAATATAAAMAEARVMVAVKVMRTSNNNNDDAMTRRRDDANDAKNNADGEGPRRMDNSTARRWWGVEVTASPDGRRGAWLRPAATALRRQDDDDGR